MDKKQNLNVWNNIESKCVDLCTVLRKKMLNYCKVVDKAQRDLIMMDMVRRVECNAYAILLLSKYSLQESRSVYLKVSNH